MRGLGHRAVLVDMFLGLEAWEGEWKDIFDAPDGLCTQEEITSQAPDLAAVRASRRDQSPSLFGPYLRYRVEIFIPPRHSRANLKFFLVLFLSRKRIKSEILASRRDQSPSLFGPGVLEVCRLADAVFLGLHGECGEDGRVEAAFDLLGIPYTGSGHLGSGMAMNKLPFWEIISTAGRYSSPRTPTVRSRPRIFFSTTTWPP